MAQTGRAIRRAARASGLPKLFKVWVYVYYNDGGIDGADVTAEKDGVTINADHLTSASDGEGNGVTTFTDLPGGRYDFNCPDYDGYHITGVDDYSDYLIDKYSFDTWLEFHGEVE